MNHEPNSGVETFLDAIVSILFVLGLIITQVGMVTLIPVVFSFGFGYGLTYLGAVMMLLSLALSRI